MRDSGNKQTIGATPNLAGSNNASVTCLRTNEICTQSALHEKPRDPRPGRCEDIEWHIQDPVSELKPCENKNKTTTYNQNKSLLFSGAETVTGRAVTSEQSVLKLR
ncbi:hypothetical protein EVAR_97724_1 [Eumeta japonica]|uniref:Uncharacterized protein n=1 Tax=Eumeta variegata TaxID=151549 RepID=A0A4C1XVI6_EUMVA|nr:hypothetical protein EVAR_97724_1 [Eumeta japonica]